ncbi:MAG TPA: adenylate/guanylate cyclase domain-containing protein [Mycobacteriales bacterium]|nr:adenylate/guanylate cyclase domain-containing protein [Mycobacteriales bacterium]
MRSCPACGTANPDAAKFCAECGVRLAAGTADQEQRKTVTVLFSDVTGSTALGDRLEPESLRRMLSRFFETARSVVERHGGTVEKFIGDAVMAIFGVPVVHEDDALRALRAASDLMESLGPLNSALEQDFGATLQIRIGVNTGDVVTGTSERLATGDAVNVAARLEQLAPPGQIYAGEMTAELAGGSATLEELEPALLKGKTVPSRVFRLISATTAERAVRATPMVGRKRQLEMLRGAFDQAVADRACVLFTVLGTAGVGKSRLVGEFLRDVDATVVRGRCLSYGNGVGLWPAVEVVRQLQQGSTFEHVNELLERDEAVAGSIRALVDGDAAVSSTIDIAWGVRRLLEHVATVRPLVVVLDDLHWAHEALFDVVEHVVTLSRDAPLLVLAMARPELLEHRQGWGSGSLNASTVLLEPLAASETEELIDALSTSLDPAARAKVKEASAGNPLFAEEMVALVEASGGADVRVPPTIQALLAARLDQLDPAELRALECGAVEGHSFHRRAVVAMGADDPELSRRLLGLVRKDLLRPEPPTLGRDEAFRFRHLLLRDAAYDRLPKSSRAELHERFARWLDQEFVEVVVRDELVGHHLEQAYRYRAGLGPVDDGVRRLAQEAADRLEAAGRKHMARRDVAGAVDLLDRARALSPRERPDVSLELGTALAVMMCGRPAEAFDRANAVLHAATRAGDRIGSLQAQLTSLSIGAHSTGGADRVQQIRDLTEIALPRFEAAGDDGALAWGWWALVQVAHQACRFGDGLEAGLKCRMYAERSDDAFLTTEGAHLTAHITMGPTPIPQALQMLEELRDRSAGFDPWVDVMRATMLAHVGRFDEARALHDEMTAAFRDRGQWLAAAIAGQCAWQIAMASGDVQAAVDAGRQSCAELDRMGERGFMSTNAAQLAEALAALGHDEEAQEWVERSLELGEDDDAVTQAQARLVRALLRARGGDARAARLDVDHALSITEGMQAPQTQGEAALLAASVFSTLGDVEAAEDQLRRAVQLFTAKGAVVYAARATEALASMAVASGGH